MHSPKTSLILADSISELVPILRSREKSTNSGILPTFTTNSLIMGNLYLPDSDIKNTRTHQRFIKIEYLTFPPLAPLFIPKKREEKAPRCHYRSRCLPFTVILACGKNAAPKSRAFPPLSLPVIPFCEPAARRGVSPATGVSPSFLPPFTVILACS